MLDVVLSSRFKKDLKLAARREYDFDLLEEIVDKLARKVLLPEKNKDHALSGDYPARMRAPQGGRVKGSSTATGSPAGRNMPAGWGMSTVMFPPEKLR